MNWLKAFFSSSLYIQLWQERLKIVHVESRTVFDERPYIAIDKSEKKDGVVAVGNEAYGLLGSSRYEVLNPFSHPRLLVNDFNKAEKILQYGVREVCRAQRFRLSPIAVIHPYERLEGGLSGMECRLFRELALGAGARKAYLHIGDEIPVSNFALSKVIEPKIIT